MEPENNEHMQILLDHIDLQVWYLIDERTYGLVNQAHADFFGVQKEELQNKDLYELMSTREEAEKCIAGNLEVFTQKQKIHTEELVLNGSGEERLLSITKTPKLDQHDNVEYVICSAEDITELKREERRLTLLSSITENVHDSIVATNTQFGIIYLNKQAEELFGYSLEEVAGQNPTIFNAEPGAEKLEQEIFETVEAGGVYTGEWLNRKKDGTTFICEHKIMPLHDDKGNIYAYVGLQRDVTSQKQTENKLKENQELFNKVLEATNDGIWDWNVLTGEAYLSNNYYTMLGYAPGDFEPNFENWRSSLHPEDREGAERQIEECFAGKKDGYNIEFRAKTKEGGYKWIQSRGKIVETDENGNPTRAVGSHIDINEKKEQEEMIRSIINAAQTVALIVTDLNSIVKEFSPGAETILGYSREEILGTHVGPLHSSSEVQKFPEYIEKLRRNREGFTMETELVRKSGEYFPARFTLQPLFDNEGNLSGTLGVSIDISDLKETERKLRESETKFRSFIENANDIIFTVDDKASFNYVSPNWEEILGYKVQETINENIYEFIHYEDTHRVASAANKILQEGYLDGEIEYKVITKNSNLRWHAAKLSVLDRKEDETIVLGVGRDITERKELEEELKDREQKYRNLFEQSVVAIYLHDLNGQIIDVNQLACSQLQYSREELLDLTVFDIHPDAEESVNLSKEEILEMWSQWDVGETHAFEAEHQRRDGTVFPVEVSTGVVYYEKQKLILALVKDIIDRKEAENELKSAYDLLENEIRKASRIHERILPQKIPQPRNLSIAAHFQPAEIMGGDFYHVIQHDGKLIFYLSDVSGHGLDGAMVSVFIKDTIDNYVQLQTDQITPGRIIEYISKQYYRENYPDDQMICILVGVIELDSMELKYSSAGFQNNPLVQWGTGEREKLETSGLFISNTVPYELLNFEESSVYLDNGTTIMFSTDGLTEQKSGEELFYQCVEEVFYRYSHFTPEIIVQAIKKEFCFFNNYSPVGNDDITFLILQMGNLSNQQKNFNFEINSDLLEIEPLYEEISDIISGYKEKENFLTCLHELVANAIEHGNQFDPDKKVAINLTLTPQFIAAEVGDEGEGFNWCEKLNKPLNIEHLTERGRGIPLTNLLARNLYFNREGNRATLVIEQ